jgi:acetyltransferase EpsM
MVTTPLVILGSHVFAEEVADLAVGTGQFELTGFIENWDRTRCEQPLLGRPVTWIEDAEPLARTHQAVCAIGSTRRHEFVEAASDLGFEFATLRHPSAQISPQAEIAPGCIVNAGVVVATGASLGGHVIANRGVLIGHHTRIGPYVTLSPGANVAGLVEVGERAYIAMGATIIDRVSIGGLAVVGAGAVVTRDVPERVQVQGVPARVAREGVEGR